MTPVNASPAYAGSFPSPAISPIRSLTGSAARNTWFPFKTVQAEGSISESAIYAARERISDLGYLRQADRTQNGTLGYRCSGEPVENLVRKGGAVTDTVGRKRLCNGLTATIGLGQMQDTGLEKALLTAGNELENIARFLAVGRDSYSAGDVVEALFA